MQSVRGVKGFATRPLGRVVLIVVAIAALSASFIYLGPFLAIPTFLLVGLALPIYMGWKRPRQLAIAGLVILLVCGPIVSIGEASLIRVPAPLAASFAVAPYGVGGSVMQNASVAPYTGAAGGLYHWSVDLRPSHVPKGQSGVLLLTLFATNCPGTLGPGSSACSAGYPFYTTNHSFGVGGTTKNQTVVLNLTLPGSSIWYWQIEADVQNLTPPHNLTRIFLDASGFITIEGPVSGDFFSTFGLVVPGIYIALFLYSGVVFYVALIFYLIFKVREQRRKAARVLPPTPGEAAAPASESRPPPGEAPPSSQEVKCPNCGALVYPSEARCWKCGVDLPGTTAKSPPLPSKP